MCLPSHAARLWRILIDLLCGLSVCLSLLLAVGPSSLPAPLTAPPAPSHDGRVRAFPHVEGNYATAVYIPLLPDAELQVFISAALAALRAHVPGLRPTLESPTVDATAVHNSAPQASAAGAAMAPPTVFGAAAAAAAGALPVGPLAGRSLDGKAGAAGVAAPPAVPHHISLSRTAAVRMPQIESLVESLQRAGRRFAPLELTLSGLKVFINDERTRTFLALPVAPPGAQAVNKMIAAVDRAFVMHGLPRFYEDPQPHVSIGWVAGDQQAALERAVAASISTAQLRGRRLADFTFKLRPREVLCRVGQRVNVIWSAGGAAGAAGTR